MWCQALLTFVMHCSAVLFPLVVTVYVTWWFLTFFDNFFSVRYPSKQNLPCASLLHQTIATLKTQMLLISCSRYMKLCLGFMFLDLDLLHLWLSSSAQVITAPHAYTSRASSHLDAMLPFIPVLTSMHSCLAPCVLCNARTAALLSHTVLWNVSGLYIVRFSEQKPTKSTYSALRCVCVLVVGQPIVASW